MSDTNNTAQIKSRSYDSSEKILTTHLTDGQFTVAAFGCAGTLSKGQKRVARGLEALQNNITVVKILGDQMEHHFHNGVPLNNAKYAEQLVRDFHHKIYKGRLPYDLSIGNHEEHCFGSGPGTLNHALNKSKAYCDAIYNTRAPIKDKLQDNLNRFNLPDCYYLEKIYDAQGEPRALIVHIDSSTLPSDPNQKNWLRNILAQINEGNNDLAQFSHKIVASHHSIDMSPDKRGQVVSENPHKYPQQDKTHFTGNHHRVLGFLLRDLGMNASEWFVWASHAHTASVIESYRKGSADGAQVSSQTEFITPHQPAKLQLIPGAGGSEDNRKFATMLPGLVFAAREQGFATVDLHQDGSFDVKYYNCENMDLDSIYAPAQLPNIMWQRHYDVHGLSQDSQKKMTKLNPQLFTKPKGFQLYSRILRQYLDNRNAVDWRSLAWTIVATTDWVNTVTFKNAYLSTQLFDCLLKVNPMPHDTNPFDKQLSKSLINHLLTGIQRFFDYYLSDDYQGYYTTFFCQLAFWHQALNEIGRLLEIEKSKNNNRRCSAESAHSDHLKAHFEAWLEGQGDTGAEEDEDEDSDENDEVENLNDAPQPQNENRFDIVKSKTSQEPILYTFKDLDAFINIDNKQTLIQSLQDVCLALMQTWYGTRLLKLPAQMQQYNEFAQGYKIMTMLACDPVQTLSSIFSSCPNNWYAHFLEKGLAYCYLADYKRLKNGETDNMLFKFDAGIAHELQNILDKNCSEESKLDKIGVILRQLAENKPPCWEHFFKTDQKAAYNMISNKLVREQMRDCIAWLPAEDDNQRTCEGFMQCLQQTDPYSFGSRLCYFNWVDNNKPYQELFNKLYEAKRNRPDNTFYPERCVKQWLQENKQYTNAWRELASELAEWLLVSADDNECEAKWQKIRDQWPQEWIHSDFDPLLFERSSGSLSLNGDKV